MKRIKQLLVMLLISLVVTLGAVGCDFFNGTTTSAEATTNTTVVETTVTTASVTETETSLPETTVSETTTITTTALPITETTTITTTAATTVTTTAATTTAATTTAATTTTAAETTIIDTTAGATDTTTVPTTTEITTTYVDGESLVITSPTKTVYEVFDSLNLSGLVVKYYDSQGSETILTDTEYTVSSIDMTTYGTKEVIIEYQTYASSFLVNVNLPTYLTSATDLDGSSLLLQLRTIINNGFDGVSYGDARYILDETDEDPNNSNNVIQVYTGLSVTSTWSCASAATCNWNREHVWPQSAMPASASNSVTNMASDLQNLKPADYYENSYRGNKYFSNTSTSTSYEPRDEVKGDVARIMLYMVVMYDELTLVDSSPNIDNYEMGLLSVLLDWNEQDPVDDFERNRNNIIYSYQGNYNPFILYPDFADLIW